MSDWRADGPRRGLYLTPQMVYELLPSREPPPRFSSFRENLRSGVLDEDPYYENVLIRSLAWARAAEFAFTEFAPFGTNPYYGKFGGSLTEEWFLFLREARSVCYGFTRLPDGDITFGVTVWSDSYYRPSVFPIEVDGLILPVVGYRLDPENWHHSFAGSYSSLHPCHGTAACIAYPQAPEKSDWGWGSWPVDHDRQPIDDSLGLLTAGHLAKGALLRGDVDLAASLSQCISTGRLSRIGSPHVDACIIVPNDWFSISRAERIPVAPLVAPGTRTTMRGQAGGVIEGMVASLGGTTGVLSVDANFVNVEFLVLLDRPAYPGDSGALVRDLSTGVAVGLYLGSAEDITGSSAFGRCQLMRQVELFFQATFYEAV
jgi:hypothetical protein